ncbi:MAG: RDD family protein [Alphaproteobacteria bacterium]|nr:RDD family protein [Alphaproteobacteria bacterium]
MSTNNFIFNFAVEVSNDDQKKYASLTRRTTATLIDVHITLIIRAIFMQIVFSTFFYRIVNDFINDLDTKFGTRTPKNTPEHISFLINHPIFIYTILFVLTTILLGAFYHAYFNSSNWQATIGKRIMGIIISQNNSRISFSTGLFHYLLSIIPYLFVIFLIYYIKRYNYQIYEVFTQKKSVAVVGILILIANHLSVLNKKRINFFDYLAKVEFIQTKTPYKFPTHSAFFRNK